MPLPDGPAWRSSGAKFSQPRLPRILLGLFAALLAGHTPLHAGDILRGGAPAGVPGRTGNGGVTSAEAARARANAQDALSRTTNALKSVRAMQDAARAAAQGQTNLGSDPNHPGLQLPSVPNGLTPGGLEVAPGVGVNPVLWQGAQLPKQNGSSGGAQEVKITQTKAQAILNWKTFNVGKQTTVTFDQSAGGAQSGQWIAFNKIQDPSGIPSQILGRIQADGQIYLINPNGIIFGGTAQINTHTLVASSLPINDNLIRGGLLSNPDAQFLFSTLPVPGGSDGTPTFTPITPLTPTGRPGDVVVQAGARLDSNSSGDGNGGRIMLVGPRVTNNGTISTPSGQTILAAGLQVGVQEHVSTDPSLRGLNVWVGDVSDWAGASTNSGHIEALTGSVTMAGRKVDQLGAIESTTSVTLNGRIDLLASYGAVGNPPFDNSSNGGPIFLNQGTGIVTLGPKSSTSILPDYNGTKTVPGTSLPEKSQINIDGLAINFRPEASIHAPNGNVTIRAGGWSYSDPDGNRTTLDANGIIEDFLSLHYNGSTQNFLFSGGQIFLSPTSWINVAGSTNVFVPLSQSILQVEFRGTEFADSPVQRNGVLRALPLTVDLRRSGISNGRYWIGTPLGDASGFAGLIQKNAAQLTATGGLVSLRAGGSIAVQNGAKIDVSGGYFRNEAGMVKTSRLMQDGHLVDIQNAQPGQVYDGVYTGISTESHPRWGVSQSFTVPWMTGEHFEQEYIQGANGGNLSLTAANMAIDGELLGVTVAGPRQRSAPPDLSSLTFRFKADHYNPSAPVEARLLTVSPTPPQIIFSANPQPLVTADFTLEAGLPAPLPASRVGQFFISPALLKDKGFGHLTIENTDGDIIVPEGVRVETSHLGSIIAQAANISILGEVLTPAGKQSFTAYNISPQVVPLLSANSAAPPSNVGRGLFVLGPEGRLDAAGLRVNDRPSAPTPLARPLALHGGSVSILSYDADLRAGSSIDVSGGVAVSSSGAVTYGTGGSITIRTGLDPNALPQPVVGGTLKLNSRLAGYSGGVGGSLTIRTSVIQIGGATMLPDTLLLSPDFFRQGGFTSYALEAIGGVSDQVQPPGQPQPYVPGILIAPGTKIEPAAESWLAVLRQPGSSEVSLRPMLKPQGLRTPVNLSFTVSGSDDSFTLDRLEIRGDLVMGAGSNIVTDPGAKVAFKGQTVTMLGSVTAPGGAISIAGGGSFPLAPNDAVLATFARPTVFLGPQSELSVAGAVVRTPDAFGRRLGTLLPGGTISVSGNILAPAGAVLDASGSSAIFDVHPTALENVGTVNVPANSGINFPLWKLRSTPVRLDSNGGMIDLQGSQMLFSDATLLGAAGGPTALGGTLSVFSGRFYPSGAPQTSADINLNVTQNGHVLAGTNGSAGIGLPVLDANGGILAGMGYFAVDRFTQGGFDSLDLGYKFIDGATLSFGGNVNFQGPVSITVRGNLRVAGGGVIQSDSAVHLTGKYVAIGQAFRPPLNPDDTFLPFTQSPANPGPLYTFGPTFGPGSLSVQADLIDIGTLSLQNVGSANFTAVGGDIRGNGTLDISGDLKLTAAQIYPTTLTTFNVFAYEKNVTVALSGNGSPKVVLASPVLPSGFGIGSPLLGSTVQSIVGTTVTLAAGANLTISKNTPVPFDPGSGSVTIAGSGSRGAPLSVGGSLHIYSSTIKQGGILRAPLGSITLGWDGTDFDPSTAVFDVPPNPVAGTKTTIPVAKSVTLGTGSVTSVSVWSGLSGTELLIPFGLSTDGTSWIDPRGVNVTTNGLPAKRISIAGDSVVMNGGATIDIRGGGDVSAYRWISGPGGSVDILGNASAAWSADSAYKAGDLVTSGGKTWSARVAQSGQTPATGPYWTQLVESYAVIPNFDSEFAPYAPFNTGPNAKSLDGDPGYVSNSLRIGDQIYLAGGSGLQAGVYTLLPRRYALLPGAYLVTPTTGNTYGTYTVPEGATYLAGYRLNQFNQPLEAATLRSQFEIASPSVVAGRASYDRYLGNTFFSEAAKALDTAQPQRLPIDAGSLAIQGNSAVHLDGLVISGHAAQGRGAEIDISSFSDIYITGSSGTAPAGATAVLSTAFLNRTGASSLLIGGLRRHTSAGAVIDVRSDQVVLDNPGNALEAPDLTLAAGERLTVTDGSSMASGGVLLGDADPFTISGDGTLLRVSTDNNATITRSNTTASTAPLMTIGAGAKIAGHVVILDSSYGTALDPTVHISAHSLTLGSGQISVVLSPVGSLTGSVVPQHLVISGQFLEDAQQVTSLTLKSYRRIDIYGAGTFGSPTLDSLTFLGSGIRGYEQGGGVARFQVGTVTFSNPSSVATPAAPAVASGQFQVDAGVVQFGDNAFSIAGYRDTILNASGGILGEGMGTFSTPGNLTITSPLITGARSSNHAITAGGALVLQSSASPSTVKSGLGATIAFTGDSVVANCTIELFSGLLTLRATGSGQAVKVGGRLSVAGATQEFYDLTRYSDGGEITIVSDSGDVDLQPGGVVSVAAPAGGGNAGTLSIKATQGSFKLSGGMLQGQVAPGGTTGSFIGDVGSVTAGGTFDDLGKALNAGGFFEQRNLRVRTGNVEITNPDGQSNVARNFALSTDLGNILVSGKIDASGETGGSISLSSHGDLTLAASAVLTVHAADFSSAGKGGAILLEAGSSSNGVANIAATLDLTANSTIDLGVDALVPGLFTTPGSSAFYGQFTGTLHLRAPRNASNTDIGIRQPAVGVAIGSTITGASSILAEGYEVVDLTAAGGLITGRRTSFSALPTAGTVQRDVYDSANNFLSSVNYDMMMSRLLGADPQSLTGVFVLAPGAEIINTAGDLTLGVTEGTSLGNGAQNSGDWNLSDFRFGAKKAPGILTLRAAGDIVFNKALSDGFTPVTPSLANGSSTLWLGLLKNLDPLLPVNTQSWSYRLTAGADFTAARFDRLRDSAVAGSTGSLLVGQFYSPNLFDSPGFDARTFQAIAHPSGDTRFQVVRTGTGDIDVNVLGDVQLRNQFATIYTAGVRIPTANVTSIYSPNDFVVPILSTLLNPGQGSLGAIQQIYPAQWSLAGGNVSLAAGGDIWHSTMLNGDLILDSTKQSPNNWLYRRGYVDATTGAFGRAGTSSLGGPNDTAASTAWWVDYSNFFEGVGALGGGHLTLVAGGDVINVDAAVPTTARMPGRVRNPDLTFTNVAPDAAKLVENGGGDLVVRAGGDISGGMYYVERGHGSLVAGGAVTTNEARSPSRGIFGASQLPASYNEVIQSRDPEVFDPLTWLPTTLYLGKGSFDVTARGDVLLGPVVNPFLLPPGLNNKFWYKTYFSTYAPDSSVNVASYGGTVTHRLAVTPPGLNPISVLENWMTTQNLIGDGNAGFYQPWIRLAETQVTDFSAVVDVMPPTLRSTSFAGDIDIVGEMNLYPAAKGTLELAAAGAINGLVTSGRTVLTGQFQALTVYTPARINVSDADPASIPGIATPFAYVGLVTIAGTQNATEVGFLDPVNANFAETGSFAGDAASIKVKQALHAPGLLHAGDTQPLKIYATGGNIGGLTLFSPKSTQVYAENDISDVSFYIENVAAKDISIVSAGRDIVLFNKNTPARSVASNLDLGNVVLAGPGGTADALPGDLQINGPGVLEVLSGRNLDLGTGSNLIDGTGVGITSIGNVRNPNLPFEGADLIAFAGVGGPEGVGPAQGLSKSTLDVSTFLDDLAAGAGEIDSEYLIKLGINTGATGLTSLTDEQQAIVAIELFFHQLRDAGRNFQTTHSYAPGLAAIAAFIQSPTGNADGAGEVFTRARDIRTTADGAISLMAVGGGLTMASDIFGNPLTPPGIVTEFGGPISIYTEKSVNIGQGRIFTLRGGDIIIWSSTGDIAAGNAPKTVVTAPPTRVAIDAVSADVKTDLGGLATGGGIGVLASVEGVMPGDVDLIAPTGVVDAGDAGIRSTGNLNIAATAVLNASNIQVGGTSTGVPSAPQIAAPNLGALGAANSASGAQASTANQFTQSRAEEPMREPESIITVEVLGYGGGEE